MHRNDYHTLRRYIKAVINEVAPGWSGAPLAFVKHANPWADENRYDKPDSEGKLKIKSRAARMDHDEDWDSEPWEDISPVKPNPIPSLIQDPFVTDYSANPTKQIRR
jgi:hypothetical protein